MREWLWLLTRTLHVLSNSRRDRVLEDVLLRQQLAVALRGHPPPRLRCRDRLFWTVARRVCANWRRHLVLVRPETVLRWHRRGRRLVWWWRSRRPIGRPRVPAEVRDLLAEHLALMLTRPPQTASKRCARGYAEAAC